MGNTSLLRREAEITLLQPHLGDSRRQELRNSPFWSTPLFKSQSRMQKTSSLKNAPQRFTWFCTLSNKPFHSPHHNKKRGSYRKCLYGGNSSQSSNQSFCSGRGKLNNRGFRSCFRSHLRGRGRGNPSPQWLLTSLSQSTSRRSPPFFQKRLANKQMFRRVKHYHQWLPFISKPNLVRAPLSQSGYKALQTGQALASCVQSLPSKNAIERVENVKSLGFYSCLFLVPKPDQRWRPVIDLCRLKTCRKVQN